MKKLVLKTAVITLGVTVILALAAFGIVSLIAPGQMMRLAFSLGLERIGADYAYQEYERSGDVECLARSFEVCDVRGYDDNAADTRFELLYTQNADAFAALAETRNEQSNVVDYDYRDYIVGLGVCVKYRLASDEAAWDAAIGLAFSETDADFPAGNPVIALAVEAAEAEDAAFCGRLLDAMKTSEFEITSDFINIVTILEGIANE